MADRNSPILDYASPRQRRVWHPLRLATKSVVKLECAENGVVVKEFLAVKQGSILAIAFAALVLLLNLTVMIQRDPVPLGAFVIVALGLFFTGFGALLLWVINDTWASTTLNVRPDAVELKFASPMRRRRFHWPADQVAEMFVQNVTLLDSIVDPDSRDAKAGELVITIRNSRQVHLFSGHRFEDIEYICREIRRVLWPPVER